MDSTFSTIMAAVVSLIRIVTTLFRPVSEWVLNFLYRIVVGRTKPLPPITNKILLMSATEVAEKIRKRQLSVEEVVSTYIQRCKDVHPMINAQVDERFEEAMKEAVAMDKMLANSVKSEAEMRSQTPFFGVPFTCKEAIGVKGLSQTSGLVPFKDRKAPKDSDVTALYRKAGAIPIVVSNVPEFCMWWESANLVHGWTKNPYDNIRTVGGSSGGEGAIITACGAVMGIGNDIAGSIRIPASFCGIYGHKPSRDLISNGGHWPDEDCTELDVFVSTGPMCRYVEDLTMLTKILSGPSAHRVPWDHKVDFRRVKIYYMEEFPGWRLSATEDIKGAVRKAANYFEEQFDSKATRLNIPELEYGFYMWECKLLEAGGPPFKAAIAGPGGRISIFWEFIKSLFRASDHTWPALYFAAVDRRTKDKFYYECLDKYNELKRKLEEYLDGEAILLVPTHPDPPPHYLMTIPKYPNIAYTCIFSILGYPSSQIPTGLSNGLPIGIQAISTQYKDHLTLAAAEELDKVFGGWMNPGCVAL